jgi:hypothetical protein
MGHDYAAPMSRVFSSQCPHSSSNSTTPFQISIPSEIEGIEKKNDKKTIRRKFQGNCYLLNPHSNVKPSCDFTDLTANLYSFFFLMFSIVLEKSRTFV